MIGIRKTDKNKIDTQKYKSKKLNKGKASETINTVESSFLSALKQTTTSEVQEQNIENISELVEKIDKQSKQFAEHPVLEELIKYKKLIQQFLKKVVSESYGLETQRGIRKNMAQQKKYLIIKTIDEKMDSLTKMILHKEKKTIHLLQGLDEIRGLLIDLYK